MRRKNLPQPDNKNKGGRESGRAYIKEETIMNYDETLGVQVYDPDEKGFDNLETEEEGVVENGTEN